MRLDLFLKTSRLVKRRAVAQELCEAGRALVNSREAKPAKDVRPGDRVTLIFSGRSVEIEVLAIPSKSFGSGVVESFRLISEKRRESGADLWKRNPS